MAQQKAIVMENVRLMKFLEDTLDYREKKKKGWMQHSPLWLQTWWRLISIPTLYNDYFELELPGV